MTLTAPLALLLLIGIAAAHQQPPNGFVSGHRNYLRGKPKPPPPPPAPTSCPSTITTVWSLSVPGMGASVGAALSADNKTLFSTDGVTLFAFNLTTQAITWSYALGDFGSTWREMLILPVEDAPVLLVGNYGDGGIMAFHTATGAQLWVNYNYFPGFGGRLSRGGRALVADVGENIYLINAYTGVPVWTAPANMAIVYGNGRIVLTQDQNMYAAGYDFFTGAQLWQVPLAGPMTFNDKYAALHAFTFTDTGRNVYLLVVDVATGNIRFNTSCTEWYGCRRAMFSQDGRYMTYTNEVSSTNATLYKLSLRTWVSRVIGANTLKRAGYYIGIPLFPYATPAATQRFTNNDNERRTLAMFLTEGYPSNISIVDNSGITNTALSVPVNPTPVAATIGGGKCIVVPNPEGLVVLSDSATVVSTTTLGAGMTAFFELKKTSPFSSPVIVAPVPGALVALKIRGCPCH